MEICLSGPVPTLFYANFIHAKTPDDWRKQMSKVTDLVTRLARPVAEAQGCELWDVEFVREAGEWFLRVTIDKEGGVSIDDCEAVSRALDPLLDEADPIEQSYNLEVSSAGLERALKRPSDFERFMGSPVAVKLYKAMDGGKEIPGVLRAYDNGAVTIETEDGETTTFERARIAAVHLRME